MWNFEFLERVIYPHHQCFPNSVKRGGEGIIAEIRNFVDRIFCQVMGI